MVDCYMSRQFDFNSLDDFRENRSRARNEKKNAPRVWVGVGLGKRLVQLKRDGCVRGNFLKCLE